jgi:hypothetical protein
MSTGRVFQFSSSASLEKLTGRKAHNLEELLRIIESCPDSSIFYHTFSAFRKMREVQAPFTNDFAVWIAADLNEEALAEKLLTIDLSEYNTIATLRSRIVEIIERHRDDHPFAFQKTADEPFYLYDVVWMVYLTDKFAYDLASFRQLLDTISIDSLYYHFIESRLHTKLQTDDFSTWIEQSLGLSDLARRIRTIDINIYSLEGLVAKIGQLVDEHLATRQRAPHESE